MPEYKVCETCEVPNGWTESSCESCGASLDGIFPTELEEQKESVEAAPQEQVPAPVEASPVVSKTLVLGMELKLVSQKEGTEIPLPHQGGVLGREGIGMEYFSKSPYVSRHHVQVFHTENAYTIIHQGSNPTKINGVVLEKGVEYPIKAGDQITIADLDFGVQ